MAKLYAEITSDQGGRVVGQGGDEYITITARNGNINIFDITFKNDGKKRGKLEILNYYDGDKYTIDYDPIPF